MLHKLNKIKMTIKKTEYISVEVSEENGYDMPDEDATLVDLVDFINDVKEDFVDYISDVDYAEAKQDFKLETFTVEEE